jgi:hypothetical protein
MFEGIRAFFGARIGSRWSLYFVHKREGLRYTLHDDAVDILLGYVLAHVKKGKRISADWELHLNFNFEHKSIRLVEAFFSKDGVSQTLFDLIAAIDSDWMVPRGELVGFGVERSNSLEHFSITFTCLCLVIARLGPGDRVTTGRGYWIARSSRAMTPAGST